jgi:erythromycin esterase-like protein
MEATSGFPDALLQADPTITETLEQRFKEREQDYVSKTSRQEWHRAWRHALILRQGARLFSNARPEEANFRNLRDLYMAENIQWIAADEGPETGMMVWAHNGHVSLGGGSKWKPMGQALKEGLGARLLVFGFAFGHGSFQAIDRTVDSPSEGKLRTFTVGSPPEVSLDATLAAAEIPIFVLDLRRAGGRVGRWLRSDHPTRSVAAVFVGPLSMLSPVVPAERYDALVFVNETSAVRKVPFPKLLTR